MPPSHSQIPAHCHGYVHRRRRAEAARLLDRVELALGTRWAVEDHFVGSVVIQVDKVRFPTFGVSLRYYVALLASHASG